MVQLTNLLLALTTSTLLVSASSHQPGLRRGHHHSKIARQVESSERIIKLNRSTSPAPASFSPRHGSGRIKKRADGKVCRIKTGTLPSATASQSSPASKTASATVTGASSVVSASQTQSQSQSQSQAASSQAASVSASSAAAASSSAPAQSSAAATSDVWTSAPAASPTWTSTSAVPASTTSASSGGGGTVSPGSTTPNGKKAGIAGGDSYPWVKDHIGWWYDWNAEATGNSGTPVGVNMLWGAGVADGTDASRLAAFKSLSYTPTYVIGYEEPDCFGSGSAGFDHSTGASLWNEVLAPLGQKGSLLLSPSMCHQAAESGWLQPFQSAISRDWDITNIHINKNNMAGVKADIDHYYNTYGQKPIWVTEFACVDDSTGFTPCTDQGEIDQFISDIVDLFQSDSRIHAYAYSDGLGLGSVWPTVSGGALSASGQAYLNAISKY